MGTGTKINLIDNLTNRVALTYTIVIFGDVNGDGTVDANDAGMMKDYENWLFEWNPLTDAAFIMAADINGDGNIDAIDADLLVDVENWKLELNQSTGLVVPRI